MPEYLLDYSRGQLFDQQGRMLDLATRRWERTAAPISAERVSSSEAVRWLQRESGAPHRVPVAIIGTRGPTPCQAKIAADLGAGLAARGVTVLCGGRGGVMEEIGRAHV